MTIPSHRRQDLVDVLEHRAAPRWEIRRAEADTITLEGYASTFEPYEMYGGPAAGGWIEQIATTGFDRTLREKPDVVLVINHAGLPLARTRSGTLALSVDTHGLLVRAELDHTDPDVQALAAKMKRGDVDEMSFAFRVKSQTWSAASGFESDPQGHRLITEVSIHRGDVSIVTYGANPTTSAQVTGRRRRNKDGTKRTMTAGEAQAIVLLDEKKRRAARNGPQRPRPADTPRERPLTAAERALVVVRAEEAQRRAYEAKSDPILTRAAQILAGLGLGGPEVPSVGIDEFVEAERARRAAVDAEIEQLRHRYSTLSALGKADRHGPLAEEIRDRTAAEARRRQRADSELEQLKRHSDAVQAIGRGGNPLPTIASRR